MYGIKIGTVLFADGAGDMIKRLIPYGFESFSLNFAEGLEDRQIQTIASEVGNALAGTGCNISCIGIYGNPLADTETGERNRRGWAQLIDAAELFGTDMVAGFAGRLPGRSVEDSIPAFRDVFTDLAQRARGKGVRLAIENCDMGDDWYGGEWNIGFCAKAWELMFEAVPYDNLGLQWEPCHQMMRLADPIAQLRTWVKKIFNLHGKDATIAWDVIRQHGIRGGADYAWNRTPGFGDCNWADVISILRMNGFDGSIDIEGFHDPVYRNELEYTGQVHALQYLKRCRGGEYVALR